MNAEAAIRVSKKTRKELKKMRLTNRETYDQTIQRLMKKAGV